MSEELYKPIPFATKYGISREGEVYSYHSKRILKTSFSYNGYKKISLFPDISPAKQKSYQIHQLVLRTYIGEPPSLKHETDHINGIRTDNRLENLAWVTRQQNLERRQILGNMKIGEKHPEAKLTANQVLEIVKRLGEGERLCDLTREFKMSYSAMLSIKQGVNWGHVTNIKQVPTRSPRLKKDMKSQSSKAESSEVKAEGEA